MLPTSFEEILPEVTKNRVNSVWFGQGQDPPWGPWAHEPHGAMEPMGPIGGTRALTKPNQVNSVFGNLWMEPQAPCAGRWIVFGQFWWDFVTFPVKSRFYHMIRPCNPSIQMDTTPTIIFRRGLPSKLSHESPENWPNAARQHFGSIGLIFGTFTTSFSRESLTKNDGRGSIYLGRWVMGSNYVIKYRCHRESPEIRTKIPGYCPPARGTL